MNGDKEVKTNTQFFVQYPNPNFNYAQICSDAKRIPADDDIFMFPVPFTTFEILSNYLNGKWVPIISK